MPGAGLADHLLVGGPELGEAHRLGGLDRHHDQVPAAALGGQVDRQPQVDVRRGHHRGLAVDDGEVPVHVRVSRAIARTMAYPIRWVKEIFPPRFRFRKLLITIRLSAINFAGTARTEVAVGTSREAVMFFTTAAAAPRNGLAVGPASGLVVAVTTFAVAGWRGAGGFRAAGISAVRGETPVQAPGVGCGR